MSHKVSNDQSLNESEVDRKISALERENFDLKMRIYYMNNSKSNESAAVDEAERVVDVLHERDMTYEQLRMANEESQRRISELETELALLKAKQESNNSSYENLFLKNRQMGSLQLEENLKRERQAAQAIAQHDAALIAAYEKEIQRLKDAHEADALLISECADRVGELMRIVEEKNTALEKERQALAAAQRNVEVLTDRISKQEILLIRNEQNQSMKTSAISSIARGMRNLPFPPTENDAADSTAHIRFAPPPAVATARPNRDHRPATGVHEDTSPSVTGNSGGLHPAPRLGAPHMISPQPQSGSIATDNRKSPPSSPRHILSTPSAAVHTSNLDADAYSSHKPKSVLFRELESTKSQLEDVRAENASLREQVSAGRKMISSLESNLERVRASAEEITLLEAEEIARLEAELERVGEERDRWAATSKKHESQAEILRQGLVQIQRQELNISGGRTQESSRRESNGTRDVSPTRTNYSTAYGSSRKSDRVFDRSADHATIDMYRRREVELLEALEGVVRRCHELESRLSHA
mmetsp:Transcript_3899/g.6108  ORF Transcript_3899/g.6108 Transcript_3899/m.6108 type:complete len:531 (+) Transcript_3899:199-1791(+)|eukprot:CAMPEP_0185041576 /NCGR_PEP_ID=MMETSP1103-20130426/41072_1 /TAXON_ID=36769 /ORGANISM="Paraphysomonas bandaiensis, Strain Caron Lab Isolate" /LENGTH=530 /DNA_ID=CAMNT_0027581375 /DNA_START=112 /DNA_END=1704 /DNA_ORIENTATION=+